MAYLKHFEIATEDRRPLEDGVAFRLTAYHVKELFLYFLPKKFYLDGSSKFQITLCVGQADVVSRTMLGSTEFKISHFDFSGYFSLSRADQEACISSLISTTLLKVCTPGSPTAAGAESALAKAADAGYSWRYEVVKLRQTLATLKLRIRVYRVISRDVGEAWVAEVERDHAVVATFELCKSTLSNRIGYYKRAEMVAGYYTIYDGLGRVAFSTNLRKYHNE